jgi:acetyl/propionyl-CoA carboxylase alpha subunit
MYYDPILAKLIVWGEDREDARIRMKNALQNYAILGIKTQIPFLKDVVEHREFINGNTFTNFIQNNFVDWKPDCRDEKIAIAVAAINSLNNFGVEKVSKGRKISTPWQIIGNWEI